MTSADDLTAFLLARLDADREGALQAAAANPGSPATRWSSEQIDRRSPDSGIWRKCWAIVPKRVEGVVLAEVPVDILPRVVKHIEAHDPARVLAEVDAKRRIVEAAEARLRAYVGTGAQVAFEWLTLRLLALPYVDHPDYRAEWHSQ